MITCTCGKTATGITTIRQGDYVDILWTTRANEKGCCSVMDLPAFETVQQAIDIACEIADLNEVPFVEDDDFTPLKRYQSLTPEQRVDLHWEGALTRNYTIR
jgi:hypothetical protein